MVDNSYFFFDFEECALIIQDADLAVRVQVLEWPQGGRHQPAPRPAALSRQSSWDWVGGGSVPGRKMTSAISKGAGVGAEPGNCTHEGVAPALCCQG